MQTTVTKELKMHKNLLMDVIKRQAGTLGKAILEGVMNAVEAEASRVDINFELINGIAFLDIIDDGIGIKSIEEVESFWETFGTPHEANENTIWKQFRMGRGQLFSFGINKWRTSQFKMSVDIKNDGLSYDLTQNLPEIDGCQIGIRLYENPIGSWTYPSIDALKKAIKQQVLFIATPIYFNGEKINIDPTTANWDIENDDAYYSFGKGIDLSIYNLGAFVMKIPASRAGTSGVIVSKQQLKVNFARNDIQSDCEIYKGIQNIITANRVKKARKSQSRLNDDERRSILVDLTDRVQSYDEVKKLSLLTTSQNKKLSLLKLNKIKQKWTFAPAGSRIADTVMEMGIAFCIDDSILYELDYTGERKDFFSWLTQNDKSWENFSNFYIPYTKGAGTDEKSLQDRFDDKCIILPFDKWNSSEKRIVKILTGYKCWDDREICVGISDVAEAWTDGKTHIVLNRNLLKKVATNSDYYATKLLLVMVHEMTHDQDTAETHYHSDEFDRYFRELCESSMTILRYIAYFTSRLKKVKISEKYEKDLAREKKAQQRKQEKLGIDVKVDV